MSRNSFSSLRSVPNRLPNISFAAGLSLLPAASIALICFVGFAAWTFIVSFTDSALIPSYTFVGFDQYRRLFISGRWWTALANLGCFGTLLVLGCSVFGYFLAALVDCTGRIGHLFGTIFVLPLSMSFVVTGIIWQWMLNPSMGIQTAAAGLGWIDFRFDWIVRSDRAIYVVAIAGMWQQTGMCMTLFLAGFRGIDRNVWKACRVDGVPTWRVYVQVIAPMVVHIFFLNIVLLIAQVAKSFDLVVALTGGGPGFASDLPARFIMEHIFERQELALGAAGASVLMLGVAIALAPYAYLRSTK